MVILISMTDHWRAFQQQRNASTEFAVAQDALDFDFKRHVLANGAQLSHSSNTPLPDTVRRFHLQADAVICIRV